MDRYLLPALLCAALLPGCGGPKSEKTDDGDDRIRHRIEYNAVEVDTLRLRSFTRELISNGRLLAARRSTLSFPVAGTIAEIRAKNGSGVRAGEPIARLDTGEYALQLRKAQLSLEKARMEFYDVLVGQGYALGDTLSAAGRGRPAGPHPLGIRRRRSLGRRRPAQPGAMHAARPLLREGRRRGPAGL